MCINQLKNHVFFKDFPLNQLEHYMNSNFIVFKEYKKGCTLHSEHTTCKKLDIVISGKLKAYNLFKNGNTMSIFEFEKNNVIGANLLFSDNNKYPLNIYCEQDCLIAHIDLIIMLELLANQNFMLNFIKSISDNSVNINTKMIGFSRKNLRKSLLDYLKTQSILQKSKVIKLKMTKKQLADQLGVQRPSLFRELKNMKDEHLIDYDSKTITILKF